MAYGSIKVDTIVFTNNSADQSVSISGIIASTSGNLTVTGTISGSTVQATYGTFTNLTGVTTTGTTANFVTLSGTTVTGTTAQFTSITGGTAGFTTVTGTTVTGTTANFVTVSGTTITGTTAQFTSITGGTAGFTTVTGTTVTGTTANFVTVSGTTVTGTTANFTSGVFTNISGITATFTSGIIASGTAALPSLAILLDPNTGIFSPGADQLAVATNGTGRLFVDASGNIGVAAAASTWSLGNTLEVGGTKPVAVWNPGDGFNALSNLYYNSAYKFKTTGGYGLYYQQNTANGAHIFATTTATGSADGTATFSETLRITSGGLVGIGSSSPGELLQVSKTGGANIQVDSGSSNVVAKFGASGAGAFVGSTSNDYFQIYSNNTARIHVTSAGLVGISTTSVNSDLHVYKGTGDAEIRITSNTANQAILRFGNTVDETQASIRSDSATNSLQFYGHNDTERARIDSSGRLLVGTTTALNATSTSTPTFQVIGAPGTSMVSSSSGSNLQPVFTLTNGNGTHTGLIGGGWGLGKISFNGGDGTNCVPSASIEAVVDGTPLGTRIPSALIFSTSTDATPSVLTTRMTIAATGNVNVVGALSKGSGSFRIDHPLSEKKDTHHLIHSFIEGPQADLIYRGQVNLINGKAIINIDEAARMAEGTFNALCTNVCCFTSNESDWTAVRGSVSDNILTIEAQDITSTAEVCWMVIGERKDQHMLDTNWTDENGRVITEPLKEVTPSVTL